MPRDPGRGRADDAEIRLARHCADPFGGGRPRPVWSNFSTRHDSLCVPMSSTAITPRFSASCRLARMARCDWYSMFIRFALRSRCPVRSRRAEAAQFLPPALFGGQLHGQSVRDCAGPPSAVPARGWSGRVIERKPPVERPAAAPRLGEDAPPVRQDHVPRRFAHAHQPAQAVAEGAAAAIAAEQPRPRPRSPPSARTSGRNPVRPRSRSSRAAHEMGTSASISTVTLAGSARSRAGTQFGDAHGEVAARLELRKGRRPAYAAAPPTRLSRAARSKIERRHRQLEGERAADLPPHACRWPPSGIGPGEGPR